MAREKKSQSRYSDTQLKRLQAMHPRSIDLSLERMEKLLDALGNPQRSLPPVIHVAGTNGKGSTTATIRAIAEASGLMVHTYTSPHLVHFHERIRLNGKLISEELLSSLITEIEDAAAHCPVTFFEATTAAAFLAFSRVSADLLVLEVGLGGRLDATNVIEKPIASVITMVDMDHEHYLGNRISEIAREKAGIMKQGVPVIISPQKSDALVALLSEAKRIGAKPVQYGKQWTIKSHKDKGLIYEDGKGRLHLPAPVLPGLHQSINAGIAVAALRHQNALHIAEAAYRAGLGWVRWPGRLQSLNDTALSQLFAGDVDIWLDGGHNPAAGKVLAKFLKQYDPVECKITLVVGMKSVKDLKGFLQPMLQLGAEVIGVTIPGDDISAVPAASIAAAATDLGHRGRIAASVEAAVQLVANEAAADSKSCVMICGSLHLAGHVLETQGWTPE